MKLAIKYRTSVADARFQRMQHVPSSAKLRMATKEGQWVLRTPCI